MTKLKKPLCNVIIHYQNISPEGIANWQNSGMLNKALKENTILVFSHAGEKFI